MQAHYDVVIAGAGHGGAQAAIALRQSGFDGSIAMVGQDAEPPYERPPLSKEYLARSKSFERILIRPESFWADKKIELVLGAEIVDVEPVRRSVTFADGRATRYDKLIWSAGGTPRRLNCEGADLEGVYAMRHKADADAIMSELQAGARRAVVIGGGYIGLEAAAVLRKLGCEVTLLEALGRVLARVAGEELSRFFEAEHRDHGVDLRLQTSVAALEGRGKRVSAVRLDSGEALGCDIVIVGIGIEPAVAQLEKAGADVSNGVVVNEYCRTSLPHVYAIGDCAAHKNRFAGGSTIRLESVQNASDMAIVAAKDICGNGEPYDATPWFWSNQYDLKLQTVGLSQGHDASVLRGNPAERSFSIIYLKRGRVIALDCVNAVKDYVQGRKLVETGAMVAPARLADGAQPLKAFQEPAAF